MQSAICSSTRKKSKGKKLFINGTRRKKPPCNVQTTEVKAKKVKKNVKKARSACSRNVYLELPQIVQDLDRFLLSSLFELDENNNDSNSDFNKNLGNLLLTNLIARISYPKFVYDDTNDKATSNRHGKEGDGNIFRPIKHELNVESLWNKKKGIELVKKK